MNQLQTIIDRYDPGNDVGAPAVTATDMRLAQVLGDVLVGIGRLHDQVADLQARVALLEQGAAGPALPVEASPDGRQWLANMEAAGWGARYDVFGHVVAMNHPTGARIEGIQVDAWCNLGSVPPTPVLRREVRGD